MTSTRANEKKENKLKGKYITGIFFLFSFMQYFSLRNIHEVIFFLQMITISSNDVMSPRRKKRRKACLCAAEN